MDYLSWRITYQDSEQAARAAFAAASEAQARIHELEAELAAATPTILGASARHFKQLQDEVATLTQERDAARREAAEAQAAFDAYRHALDTVLEEAQPSMRFSCELNAMLESLPTCGKSALTAAIEEAVAPYREDAERWRKLKPMYTAAVFDPQREDGLDLGEGIALIFMLPKGSAVSGNADMTIDAARGES